MFCTKCGKENVVNAKFCTECGMSFVERPEKVNSANHAIVNIDKEARKQVANNVKIQAENFVNKDAKEAWEKYSTFEKIVTGGSFVGAVSFFLPWMRGMSGFSVATEIKSFMMFLIPVALIIPAVSLFMVHKHKKNVKNEILIARWSIVVSSIFVAISLIGIIMAGIINDDLGKFGGTINFDIGWELLLLSQIAVLVGSFKIQKELLM